jgi:hypothetical protein
MKAWMLRGLIFLVVLGYGIAGTLDIQDLQHHHKKEYFKRAYGD